jgi:hypothetical protein
MIATCGRFTAAITSVARTPKGNCKYFPDEIKLERAEFDYNQTWNA